MSRYTEVQTKIAKILLHGPKTAEELRAQVNIPYDQLIGELKGLLKLEVILKEGFPTKYKLKENISNEVKRRKQMSEEDANKARVRVVIEVQAIEETLLEKQLNKLKEALEKNSEIKIYSLDIAEKAKSGEYYSSYLDVNFSIKNFSALVKFMFFYGPTTIEVLKPEKIELTAQDLQDGLVDIADMAQKYSVYIAKLLNRQELDAFHKQLFEKLK